MDWKQNRLLELQQMRQTDPARLIALYCGIGHVDEKGQLPYGISFSHMIDSILEREDRSHQGGITRRRIDAT